MKQILLAALFLVPSLSFAAYNMPIPLSGDIVWPTATPKITATSTATTTNPFGNKKIKWVESIPWSHRENVFFTDGTSIGLKDTDSRYFFVVGS